MRPAVLLWKLLLAITLIPVLAGIFTAGLTVVFSLPNEKIVEHIAERPGLLAQWRANNGRVIDADTECIGLSVGLIDRDIDNSRVLHRAVEAKSLYGCAPLLSWLETEEVSSTRDYFRYWHGYTVISRPVLSVLPYNDLRGHLFNISLLLFASLIWRIAHDFGLRFGLAFAAPFLVLNAFGFWVVVTKAVTWFLMIGGALYMSRRQNADAPVIAFFMLGSLTAFFDFFTTPVLVFVIPAMVYFLYSQSTIGQAVRWRRATALLTFFGVGYAGLWIAKFVIAASILDTNVWRDVLDAALFRLRGGSEFVDTFLPGAAIIENARSLKLFWGVIALVLFVVLPLSSTARRDRLVTLWRHSRLYLALAGLPVLWLEVMSNHSQIHAAFTHLNFAPILILSGAVVFGAVDPLAGSKGKDSALSRGSR